MAFEFDAATAKPEGQFDPSTATRAKPASAVRKLGDVGLGFVQGAAGASKALADASGASNRVSRALGAVSRGAGRLMSADAQDEIAARQARIQEAEQSGSAMDEAAAHLGGIAEAPARSVATGLGSIAPTMIAALLTRGKSLAPTLGIGAAQGAGAVKGSIYDAVEQRHIDAGMAPEQAKAKAAEAQSYTGENAANIAAGAVGGAIASRVGAEGAVLGRVGSRGAVRRVARAAGEEAITEGAQGGQERYAANVAEQRQGFDTPTWQGVAGQAVGEGVIGGIVGGGVGVVAPGPRQAQEPPAPPGQDAVPPEPVQTGAPTSGTAGGFDPNTAVPEPTKAPASKSQAMGIDPAAGPVSAAAAVAVDNGAAETVQRQQAEQQAAEQASKDGKGKAADKKSSQDTANDAPAPVAPPAPAAPATAPAGPLAAAVQTISQQPAGAADAQAQAEQGQQQAAGATPDTGAARGTGQDPGQEGAGAVPVAVLEPAGGAEPALSDTYDPGIEKAKRAFGAVVESPNTETDEEFVRRIVKADRARIPATAQPADAGAVQTQAQGEPAKPQTVDEPAHATAATSPTNDLPEPTEAQKKAGNYRLGRVNLGGLDISIENPQGSVRRGVDKAGKAWENTLADHYGYIRGTVGRDKDHVDVFIKPGTPTDFAGQVFVVDQVDPETGRFDEHKVVVGAANQLDARRIYARNYAKGWKGMKAITPMAWDEFKAWVKDGPKNRALAAPESVSTPEKADEAGVDTKSKTTVRPAQQPGDQIQQQPEGAIQPSGNDTPAIADRIAKTVKSLESMGATRMANLRARRKSLQEDLAIARQHPNINADDQASHVAELTDKIAALNDAEPYAKRADDKDLRDGITRSILNQARQELDAAVKSGDVTPEQALEAATVAGKSGNAAAASEIVLRAVDGTSGGTTNLPASRGPAASDAWRNEGKSPEEMLAEKVASLADELSGQVAVESSEKDFAPSELSAAVAQWAKDGKVPADDLRQAFIKALGKRGLSEGRMKQIRDALDPMKQASKEPGSGLKRMQEAKAAKDADPAAGKWFGSKEKAAQKLADLGLTDTHEVVRDGLRFELRKKVPSDPAKYNSTAADKALDAVHAIVNNPIDQRTRGYIPIDRLKFNAAVAQAKAAGVKVTTHPPGSSGTVVWTFEKPDGSAYSAYQEKSGRGTWIAHPAKGAQAEAPAPTAKKPYTDAPVDKAKTPEIVKGEIGQKFSAGQVAITSSGRQTTPFPKVDISTNGKANNTLKRVDQWLINNALAEAQSRGDTFNERQFQSVNNLNVTQSDKDSAEQYLFGEQPKVVPSILRPLVQKAKPVASANTIFTEDAAAAARARLKAKIGRLSSGLDPETMLDGITLAGYHIEKGARTFAAYAKAMIDDLGDGVKPYLKSWYMGVKYDPRASGFDGMDSPTVVDAADLGALDTTPKKADTATTGDDNATRKLDSAGPRPLEGAPSSDVRASESGRQAPASSDAGSKPDGAGDAQPDGAGTGAPGGMGAGPGAVPVPAAGAKPGATNAKKPRVSRTPRTDAGLFEPGPAGGIDTGNPAPNAPSVPAPQIKAEDFVIDDDLGLGEGGQKTKFQNNVAAIRLLQELAQADRMATPDEQKVLAKYVGWGGLPQAFDPDKADWAREHATLKEIMTPDQMADARMSTRYAHYTSRPIIVDGIYAAMRRFGFTGGKTLEAGAGVGNFLGLMPTDMRSAGRFTAIEREPFSSAIARHLYPNQIVRRDDFTEFKGNDGYFDAAVGNPPFASDTQVDRSGRKHLSGLSLHNYFFAKAVDMLREGGIMGQVVTNSFLDAKSDAARKYISDRTVFLGAIRLPNNAFSKNAGTEVTTDLIFLQKRPDSEIGGIKARADAKRWLDTGVYTDQNGAKVALNQYFIDNPGMMLGDFGAYGTMYGPDQPALVARPGQDTMALLKAAVEKLPEGVYKSISQTGTQAQTSAAIQALANPPVNEGGYFLQGNKLMQRLPDLGGEARGMEITAATQWTEKTKLGDQGYARIKALAELRGTTRALIAAEMADKTDDMQRLRADLNRQYDAYVKDHGLINDPGTLRVFDDDPDFPLLASLEHGYTPAIGIAAAKRMGVKPVPSKARKSPIFTQRVVAAREKVKKVESAADALDVSMAERGKLDAAYIGELLGKDASDVLEELSSGTKPLLFLDPSTNEYVLRDAYLSGNVRAKLAQAKAAGMYANVTELEKVQPADVASHEISARLGSPWIPTEVYEDFAKELYGADAKVVVGYIKANSSYQLAVFDGSDTALHNTWGTQAYPGDAMLSALMNNRSLKVTFKDAEGKTHTDVEATEAANNKAQEIRERFNDWLFRDPDRSELLTKAYNETNNNYVTRVYDGSHMTFPGKVPDAVIKFRRHQRNAIARIVQDRTALLDHVVGAGKTFTIVSGAMELKRTGLARKPMVAVPNHLVKQWAADFYRLYPGANVLTATKKDFQKINRRKFLAKIATGDWDAVVIAHSSFGFIKPAPEFEARFNEQQIAEIVATIQSVEDGDGDKQVKKRTVKQLEGIKERLQNRIRALRDKPMDDLLDFEQIGVDQLFVDEAHMFKNLMYSTKMQGVSGMQDPSGSQRAYDMYVKAHQIYEKNGRGQGVVFATGTPVSNSLAEMYHMMRYLMPSQMKELGFESFDAWANTFAAVEQSWMQAPSGDGFKASNRMSNFVNTPELLKIFDQVSDTVTMEDIQKAYSEENDGAEFPLPKLKGGRRTPVSLDKSATQEAYMQDIAKRAKAIEQRKGPPKKGDDNILVVMGDARKAAMDIRLVDHTITERERGGRIDRATDEAVARYRQYDKVKGTQIIFSDLGTPIKHAKAELKEYEALQERIAAGTDDVVNSATFGNESALEIMEDVEAAQAELAGKGPDWLSAVQSALRGFSVYDDFKAALIEKGVPEAEIAFIHDYNTDDQKAALFAKVNAGQIRFLMGSTAKLGAGTNVQERLVAEHHLDVPWRPSDVEQREGRIIRQGNKLMDEVPGFEIEILAYVTKDTLDMRMWQVQEAKLKMINQLRMRKIDRNIENAFEDMELSAGEMQAAATGDINLLKEIQLRNDVKKLEQQKRSFDGQRNDLLSRKKRVADRMARLPGELKEAQRSADLAKRYTQDLQDNPVKFSMTIDGKEYTDPAEAGAYLDSLTSKREPVMKDGAPVLDGEGNPTDRAAPISIDINGEIIKNRNTVAEMFAEARGDRAPIKWEWNGQVYRRRSKLATAIRQNVVDAIADETTKPVGKIGPYDVAVEGQALKDGRFMVDVTLSVDGNVELSNDFSGSGIEVVPENVISVSENLIHGAASKARWIEEDLAKAKRDAADLEKTPVPDAWPGEAKLEAARAAHKEVLGKLKQKNPDYKPGMYLVTNDKGQTESEPRNLSADDIAQLLDHGWKIKPVADDAALSRDGHQFRRGINAAGMPIGQARLIVAPVAKRLNIDVRVVATPADLPIAAPDDVRGLYINGKVYVVAGNLKTRADVMRVVGHEAIAHLGLRAMKGRGEWEKMMNQMRIALRMGNKQLHELRKEVRSAYVDSGGAFNLSPKKEADEIAALAVEQAIDPQTGEFRPGFGFLKGLFARLAEWLRSVGIDVAFTNLELQGALVNAQRYLQEGARAPEGAAVAASRVAQDQTQTPEFKAWFGDSKVVDKDGRPLVVYHGTTADLSAFDLAFSGSDGVAYDRPAVFATSDAAVASDYARNKRNRNIADAGRAFQRYKNENPGRYDEEYDRLFDAYKRAGAKEGWDIGIGANVLPLYLSIQNPLVVDGKGSRFMQVMPDAVKQASTQGYDGVIAHNVIDNASPASDYPITVYVAFKPEQIKSAIGNSGTFDPNNADIRFARGAGQVVTDIKRRSGNKLSDYRALGLQTIGRRQMVDLYGKQLPQLVRYNDLMQAMDADKNEAGAAADGIADRWGKLKDERQLANLMHDATLAQIDPAKAYVEGDDINFYDALRHGYDALSPEAKKVYADARDHYRAHHANVRAAIRDRIERSELRGPRKAELLKQMDDEFFKAIKGVYFPLARFGDYVVVVRDPETGRAINVSRAETMTEAQNLQEALRKAYPSDLVGNVLKSKEFSADRDMVGRGFMQNLYDALGEKEMDDGKRAELEDMLGQLYLSALPDLSWAKHGIHRKGTPGFSQDARRAFAQNMFHGARYLAKVRYSDLLENQLSDAQKMLDAEGEKYGNDQPKLQDVLNEMQKRHEASMNPTGNALSTALTSLGFVFHLGLSPASAMVNMTQTALVAYPVMGAKWGFDKAAAALLKASGQAATNKNDISSTLTPEERRAYDEAVRSGVIDVTMAHDLAGISQGDDAKVTWKLRPVMKWASFLFHHAEKFNRQVTFVASYRLAREAGTAPREAYAQAVKATYDGHFDYSATNRARILQGNTARVVLLFKQYAQNMVYILARQGYLAVKGANPRERAEARKALGGLLALHAAAAGVLGLPMVTTLLAAASMIGGSDDEPWDAEVALRNMLADAFGDGPADVLARGLSRLTPFDISGRVGLDRLIFPDVQEGLEGQRLGESAMAAALGPVAGIGINVLRGVQQMADGEWARGLEAMAPSALRGPIKALRYADEGAIDRTGKTILDDINPVGIAGQALGFSPSDVRLATEAKSAVHQADARLSKRRGQLMRHYSMAAIAGDEDGMEDAREDIRRFNEKNPGRRINPMQMAASVRTRRMQILQAKGGVYLSRSRRDAMQAGAFGMQ